MDISDIPDHADLILILLAVSMLTYGGWEFARLALIELRAEAHALALRTVHILPVQWRRHGGIWFGRCGRIRVSFCLAKQEG